MVWGALWLFLAALGSLWDDFWASFLNVFLSTFCSYASGGLRARFWRVWDNFFEILDLLAEEMLELISNLFLLKFKMGSSNFEWFQFTVDASVTVVIRRCGFCK